MIISFPTAAELDRVAPQHPVALIAKNGHAWVVNSAALRVAHITAETADPQHGKIGRNADGTPDGMLFEHATRFVREKIPVPALDEVVDALDVAQNHLLARGIVGYHDVDADPAFAAFQELRLQGRMRQRVVKYVRLEALDAILEAGLRTGYGDEWLHFGGLKLFVDGALGARTGAMFEPYTGEPDNVGLLTLEPEHWMTSRVALRRVGWRWPFTPSATVPIASRSMRWKPRRLSIRACDIGLSTCS